MMATFLNHQLLDNRTDQRHKTTDVDLKNILHFSFVSFRVSATFQWPGRLLYWNLISLPPITILGLLVDQVWQAVLF